MTIVGIDQSLTSTGIAYRVGSSVRAIAVGNKNLRGAPRLAAIRDSVLNVMEQRSPSLVVLEGYALGFRGKSNTIFNIGELGGVLRVAILERGVPILEVPPKCLKLFLTGHGGKKGDGKQPVILAVEQLLGVKFAVSDQYDAAGLLLMGEAYQQRNTASRVRSRSSALDSSKVRALEGCTLLDAF